MDGKSRGSGDPRERNRGIVLEEPGKAGHVVHLQIPGDPRVVKLHIRGPPVVRTPLRSAELRKEPSRGPRQILDSSADRAHRQHRERSQTSLRQETAKGLNIDPAPAALVRRPAPIRRQATLRRAQVRRRGRDNCRRITGVRGRPTAGISRHGRGAFWDIGTARRL